MYECLSARVSVHYLGGQERASDPLDLELQRVVIYYVGAGYGTCSSERAASSLKSGAFSLGPFSSVSFVKCLFTVSCNSLLITKTIEIVLWDY